MRTLADLIRIKGALNSKGGQDTITAHINPKEAMLLKMLGGSGRVDPETGFLHFDDGFGGNADDSPGGGNDGFTSTDVGDNAGPGEGWSDAPADVSPSVEDAGYFADVDTYVATPTPAPVDYNPPGLDLPTPVDPGVYTSLTPDEITGYTVAGAPGSLGPDGWGSIGHGKGPGDVMDTWGGVFSPPDDDRVNYNKTARDFGKQPGLWGIEGFVQGAQPTTGLTGLLNAALYGRNSLEQASRGWQVAQQIENQLGPMALAALNPALAGVYAIGRGLEAGKAGPAVNAALGFALGPAQSLAAAFGRNTLANYVDDQNLGKAAVNSALGIGRGYVSGLGAQAGYDIAGLNGVQAGAGLAGRGYDAAVGGIASGLASGRGGSAGPSGDGGEGGSESGGEAAASISDMVAATLSGEAPISMLAASFPRAQLSGNGGQVQAMFDGAIPILDIPDYMPMTRPTVGPKPIQSSYAQPRALSDLLRSYYAS